MLPHGYRLTIVSEQLRGENVYSSDESVDKSVDPLGRLGGRLGFSLRIAQEASLRAFSRRTGDESIKPQHYAILAIAGDFPGISQTDLGARCGRDKSSITPAIKELEKLGLIRRNRFSSDRRAYSVELTEEGHNILDQLDAHALAHEEMFKKILGKRRYDDMLKQLGLIAAGLDEVDP